MEHSERKVSRDDFASRLHAERLRLSVAANGGIAAPLAGSVYWIVLFVLGLYVSEYSWCLIAFLTSGLIFPLALLLQKLTKSELMIENDALSGAVFASLTNIVIGWSVTIAAFYSDLALVPLALAINMSLHFSGIGWTFGSKVIMGHPIVRAIVVTILWYSLPAQRFSAIPLAVGVIYLATVLLVIREVVAARKTLNG